jgi:hypothetical protein
MMQRRRLAQLNCGPEDTMTNRLLRAVLLAVAIAALLAGCATYYRITEPGSGRQYYTQDIERTRDGSVRFKDGKSKGEITLQNSEVSEISKSDYEKGMSGQ